MNRALLRVTAFLAVFWLIMVAAAMMLVSVTLGPIQLSEPAMPAVGTSALVVTTFLALSCMAELGFRGYALRTLMTVTGEWPAQVAIAVIFGLSHLASGWPWLTVVTGVVPSAVLYGVAATRSGRLALPIGIHAAMNIAQWMVGEKETAGIWTVDADPSRTVQLNAFAPWVAMIVPLVVAAVIALWPKRSRSAHSSD